MKLIKVSNNKFVNVEQISTVEYISSNYFDDFIAITMTNGDDVSVKGEYMVHFTTVLDKHIE